MYKFVSRFSLCKQEAQREKLIKEKRQKENFAACGRREGFRSLHRAAF